MENSVFYKPKKKVHRSQFWGMRGARPENGSLFLSSDQETPCTKRYKCNLRSEVLLQQLTGKLFPQGYDAQ
jgi:hypothetical protein